MIMKFTRVLLLFAFVQSSDDSIAQTIVGQAIFTQPQLEEINSRLDARSTDYWASGNGYYGDGMELYGGAQAFLLEERGANKWSREWDWFTHPLTYGNQTSEPRPGANPSLGSGNSGDRRIEDIHNAGVLSVVWKGRSDTLTFAGVTQSKDRHSKDLARSVFEVLTRRASAPALDWANRSLFADDGAVAANPLFISFAKMTKYLSTYACIQGQLPSDSDFALVESWLKDAADYAYLKMGKLYENVYGSANRYPPFSDNAVVYSDNIYPNVLYETASNVSDQDIDRFSQLYTWYEADGTGHNSVSWMQASALNNRTWDAISLIGSYGVMFNFATYRKVEKEYFKLFFQLGVFPDGTVNEWYRSYDGNPQQGLNYASVTGFHLVAAAQKHAVGVYNDLPGAGSDIGELYNYTTGRGTDEIIDGNYVATSTSGGEKGLLNYLLNITKYYKSSANGGWNDLRFSEEGIPIQEERKPFGIMQAFANTFYNNDELRDYYRGLNGFNSPDYYSRLTTPSIDSAGSWGEHSHQPWGVPTSHGRYFGLADMEGIVFSPSDNDNGFLLQIPPIIGAALRAKKTNKH